LNTFPSAARWGDTVALAVGSPVGMTRANTTATFTSTADNIPRDITANIRAIFKLYADKASEVYENGSNTGTLVGSAGHEQWVTIAVIDLPAFTPSLPLGPGNVRFNTTAVYPGVDIPINNVDIPLDILAGAGSRQSFDYQVGTFSVVDGNLGRLEARPRAVFGPAYPSVACPCPDYGAIEVKINMPTNFGPALPTPFMQVLEEDLMVNTESNRNLLYGLSNNQQDLTVMLVSMTGKLKYNEARFSVVLRTGASFTGTPTVTSIRYFDLNGSEITGPLPTPGGDYGVTMM
jgi:hypothetical protein